MKEFFSLLIAVVMVFTVMAPAFTASAEDLMSASVTDIVKVETQADNSSGGFFQAIIDFFRSLFYSRITFDTDGGSEIDDYYKLKLSRITPPADPTKEGYTFIGWEPEIPTKMPWGNLTVKAKWQVNEHKVFWVIDGVTVKTESYCFGETIQTYTPGKKEGYTLSEWSVIPETMPDEDVTISANYVANGYRVTWNVDGTKTTYVISYGNKTTVPANPQKDGYAFVGWKPAVSEIVTKDVTYTAQWEKETETIVAGSDEEFNNKVMELVNQSLNDENFDKEAALEDEFYMSRVVANCSDFSMIDFSMFEADTIVMNDDGTVVLQFANRDLAEECSDYLNSLSSVSFAEADAYVEAPEEVEVESIPSMGNSIWGEKYINADKYAYYLENNNFNELITVAVIDTGIDTDHPYFNGRLTGGRNCFTGSSYPEDDTGHGTHVSGVVINCTNNLNVKVMPIKSLNAEGGTLNSIVSGINYAVSQRVQVINLSLESPYGRHSKYLEEAIENAVSKGIIVVVAAGNGEKITHTPVDTANVSPANMDSAIVVGALDETGTKGSFSNYGDSVDVIAPGVDVPSTYLGSKYALMSGTSQAAPHIAAVAAMFKLAYPDYTPAQIEALIKQYCIDKGPSGRDDFYGEGCPDMYNAIPDCTVSFDSNGGTSVSSATTKNSSSVILPMPSKSYKVTFNANGGSLSTSYITSKCSFDGWYTTSSLTGQKYSGGESYMLLDDQTMYAKWTNNASTVANYTPTRSGYKFDGWYTAASGGTQYTNATTITGNVTVYAHWSQRSITYYANGGSGAPSTQYGYGNTTLSSTKPTRSGYQFLGWSENSSATSAGYDPSEKIYLDRNIKLYAIWGKSTVTLSSYGFTEDADIGNATYRNEHFNVLNGTGCFYYSLPSVSTQYCGSSNYDGWQVVSGNAFIYGNSYVCITQPGKIVLRYRKGDTYSSDYVINISFYDTLGVAHYLKTEPNQSSGNVFSSPISKGSKVTITSFVWGGTYTSDGVVKDAVWAKTTVNGKTGYIVGFHWAKS